MSIFQYGMGSISFPMFLLLGVILVIPFWRILPRFGLPSWAAAAAIIPLGAVVLLWLIAVKDFIEKGRQ
ncbi:MAG: hypothetical protein M5U35_08870 [Roseovarius sp.]|nr:hypothetical protein [Roseovarius sp.]